MTVRLVNAPPIHIHTYIHTCMHTYVRTYIFLRRSFRKSGPVTLRAEPEPVSRVQGFVFRIEDLRLIKSLGSD